MDVLHSNEIIARGAEEKIAAGIEGEVAGGGIAAEVGAADDAAVAGGRAHRVERASGGIKLAGGREDQRIDFRSDGADFRRRAVVRIDLPQVTGAGRAVDAI